MTITRGNAQIAEGNGVTSLQVDKPTGLSDGDVIWAALCIGASGTPNVPEGFSQFATVNQSNVVVLWGYIKIVEDADSEPDTYTFDGWTSTRATAYLVAYSGVDNETPIDVAASTGQANSGETVEAPSITTVTDGAVLVGIAGQDSASGTVTEPETMAEILESAGTGKKSSTCDETRDTAGATGARQWTFNLSLAHACYFGALRPFVEPPELPEGGDGAVVRYQDETIAASSLVRFGGEFVSPSILKRVNGEWV